MYQQIQQKRKIKKKKKIMRKTRSCFKCSSRTLVSLVLFKPNLLNPDAFKEENY